VGKAALKKAGSAAAQSLLRDLAPFFDERFTMLQDQIRVMEGQLASLREDMLDRYERQLNLINEVNDRINEVHNEVVHLGGKMEGYMEAMRLTFAPLKSKRRAG
jgi:uncharacterized coiled-coil DUF342 family protein